MQIRRIEEKDNKAVETLIRTCLLEYGGNRPGTAWCDPDLGRFSEVYAAEDSAYWVAVDEAGKVVAGVGIGPMEGLPGVCELRKMYAYREVRGTGVAQELIGLALAFAKERYRTCYLETFSNMIPAQKFYARNGFVRLDGPLGSTGHFSCDVCMAREL